MAAHLYDEPFFCLRAAIRVMKRQGHGKVVNITSAVAIPGLPNYTAYSAARAGANGLTRAVGREVARHNIQVNAIAQNFVENPTYFGPDVTGHPDKLARVVRNVPAGRLARSGGVGQALRLPGLGRGGLLLRPGDPVRGRLGLDAPTSPRPTSTSASRGRRRPGSSTSATPRSSRAGGWRAPTRSTC